MPFIQQIDFQGLRVFKIYDHVRNWYNDRPQTRHHILPTSQIPNEEAKLSLVISNPDLMAG